MNHVRLAMPIAGGLLIATGFGITVRPTHISAESTPRYLLEDIEPSQFDNFTELPDSMVQVINLQTWPLLDNIYNQAGTRTHVAANGYRIMDSLADGDDQRGKLQARHPEAFYAAQSFALHGRVNVPLITPVDCIAARQLNTSLGTRSELVIYWLTMGETVVRNRIQQRLVDARRRSTGRVLDGLVSRISSIDADLRHVHAEHAVFAVDFLSATPHRGRTRLVAIGAQGSSGRSV